MLEKTQGILSLPSSMWRVLVTGLKDTLRADDPFEKAALKEGCREIKNLLDDNQGYVFGEVKVKRESEGEWHALEVSFQHGEKTQKVVFAFLLVNGQFAIGDIDW